MLPPVHPEQASNGTDGREMLALPWRRFDRDLGDEDGEGFQICGRRMVVGDVSNSSEGTGLFTWVSERRDTDTQLRDRRRETGCFFLVQRALFGNDRVRMYTEARRVFSRMRS